MSWSTRELAELANTTVNTVRHYHAVGLLDLPQRGNNGYKQYGVHHLVRLLRLRRLTELGIPLARMRDIEKQDVRAELEQIDAGMAAELERLRRTRSDIAAILREKAPADAPHGFEAMWATLSDADRAHLHVLTRIIQDREKLSTLGEMVRAEPADVRRAFEALAPDADASTRRRLAERMRHHGPNWRTVRESWRGSGPRRDSSGIRTHLAAVVAELYNPAQRDVIDRAGAQSTELARAV